MNTNKNLG